MVGPASGPHLLRRRQWAPKRPPPWSPTRRPICPRSSSPSTDIHVVSLYVSLDGEQRPESEIADRELRDFYERLCAAATRGRRPPSPRSATSPPSTSRCSPTGATIVSIHLSAGISGTCESAQQARQRADRRGAGGERIHVYDSRTGCGGQGLVVLAPPRAARGGATGAEALERGRALPRDAEDVVRDRHARVPAQGRPDRRGARHGSARRSRSSRSSPSTRRSPRSSASAPAGAPSSGWSSTRASATRTPRRRLGRPAHPGPRDRPQAGRGVPRDLRLRARSSSPRSGP